MSCSGCRALRKGCSDTCSLRSCLQWIDSPEAQAHATLFLAKFFGRSDLISFISSIPETNRPALFQSMLFEACGRTVNPVNGAVGLLWSGNWHMCQAAVETVLAGGVLRPLPEIFGGVLTPMWDESFDSKSAYNSDFRPPFMHDLREMSQKPGFDLSLIPESYNSIALVSGESEMTSNDSCGGEKKRLLNLFV